MNTNNHVIFRKAVFMSLLLLWIYVIVRAVSIDITHDEAYSFYNVKHFWWVETLCTGNTHWFNFLAIKAAVLTGFEQVWSIRWLSIVASGVLCVIAVKLAMKWNDPIKSGLLLALLCFNPYVLDYALLARGYVTALSLQCLSIYFIINAPKANGLKTSASLLLAAASAIANFNFFYFFAAFSVLYFYVTYASQFGRTLLNRWFFMDVAVTLGTSALVVKALDFITKCSNDIGAYGGRDFMTSVFGSYLRGSLYMPVLSDSIWVNVVLYTIAFITFISCIIGLFQRVMALYRYTSVILLVMFALMIFNKWILHVLYPVDRTTLMVFPLLAVNFTGLAGVLIKKWPFVKYAVLAIIALTAINFVRTANLHSVLDYPEQTDARQAFRKLEQLNARHVGIAPELYGVYRNYYQMTENGKFAFSAESVNTAIPVGKCENPLKLAEFDYLVLFPPYNLSYYKKSQILRFEPVFLYKNTGALLVRVIVDGKR